MTINNMNPIKILLFFLGLGLFAVAIFFYQSVFSYLFLSLVFTYFSNPVVRIFENLGIKRVLAIFLFYILLFSVLFFLAYFLIPILFKQTVSLVKASNEFITLKGTDLQKLPFIQSINSYLDQFESWFPFIRTDQLLINVQAFLDSFLKKLPNYLFLHSKNIAGFLSHFIIVPVMSFFLLKDMYYFKKTLFKLIPNRYFEISIILFNRINESISTYFKTLFTEVLIVGTLTAVVLTAMGVKYGILIGIVAGLFNIVPYLGPFSAALFASVSVLLTGKPLSLVLYTILGMWAVQIIDNNIIFPLVMAKGTEIHPLYVLLTAIAGGLAFGFIGMILALPALYLISSIIQVLYQNLKDFDII
jgi:predicted PurR-regulated permease PerM